MSDRGPANHHLLGESATTSTHVLLCILVFVMATPSMNPVLVSMEVLGIPPAAMSTAALVFLAHTILGDASNVVYYSLRVFLHSVSSIFFRSIEVVGAENIPSKGPIIFTGRYQDSHLLLRAKTVSIECVVTLLRVMCGGSGNHSNQFVDGMQVLCHARHRVGFLIAEKSYKTLIIGGLAKLIGCMPVKR
jgi:glycerol-3-phosphate O-acyltransferase/dihydroxyacetone phosphate acyltransferase